MAIINKFDIKAFILIWLLTISTIALIFIAIYDVFSIYYSFAIAVMLGSILPAAYSSYAIEAINDIGIRLNLIIDDIKTLKETKH